MNACMYLEPDDYDPFDVSSYTTAAPVSQSSPYHPRGTDEYYGFQQAEVQQNDQPSPVPSTQWAAVNSASKPLKPLPLRHEITEGYAALEQLAASQNDTSARADFIQGTKRLRDVSEPTGADAQETLLKRPAKRARSDTLPLRPSPLSAGPAASAGNSPTKVPRNIRWTDEEVNILVTAKDWGQTWSDIGNVSTTGENLANDNPMFEQLLTYSTSLPADAPSPHGNGLSDEVPPGKGQGGQD